LIVLTLVICGGQTGVDQAALRAARACGIATGGWAPMGWLTETENGRGEQAAPWLADYGLVECDVRGYAARRRRNVRQSDATLLMGRADSQGSVGVINDCSRANKPLFHVRSGVTRPSDVLPFLDRHGVKILLVAGNRESSDRGIGARAERFLKEAFRLHLIACQLKKV
jgi:hypothetical protein